MQIAKGPAPGADDREQWSALVDGEAGGEAVLAACARWRDDAAMRRDWHAWHLIGDVLRSDDLASSARHDERFLETLRGRLAAEPVVLAPAPRAALLRRRSRWIASSAIAAGFVAVAGTMFVLREPPSAAGPAIASPSAPGLVAVPAVAAAEPPQIAADAKLIRDARLDRYLEAHKQFAGSSALGVPSGLLRAATTDATGR